MLKGPLWVATLLSKKVLKKAPLPKGCFDPSCQARHTVPALRTIQAITYLTGRQNHGPTSPDPGEGAGGLPMLIVQALEDAIAPKADASDLLKERFGDQLEVVLVKNAGHALLPEKPEFVSTTIVDFLKSLRDSRTS